LQRFILSFVPSAKIESTRFRSVAFATPTTKLEDNPAVGKSSTKKSSASDSSKTPRTHDLERTSAWRDKHDEESNKPEEKKFLTPAQKKKIAFINHDFHSSADSVNAYVVFAHPIPADQLQRPANLPPLPEVLDPYEAAKVAAARCDGQMFMERSIRVDLIGSKELGSATSFKSAGTVKKGKGEDGSNRDGKDEDVGMIGADPKLSVFVGNLDFTSKEEDLRVYFEAVIAAERGTASADDKTGEGAAGKKRRWVTRVRIIRDKDTQMGKGFAYVQFVVRNLRSIFENLLTSM
jgi:nucleolar protein 12